ncbi:MAG TPA: S-layer homology domain-containing protein [Anaerovoracaceae bacterium]|nr:S-layer homology domain-containing protein [Anaerovoracaceae bacterium]
MKKRKMLVLSLLLIITMIGSSVCYAAVPAEGFDPADGKYIKAEPSHYWDGRYSDGRIFSEYLAKKLTGDYDNLTNYAVGGSFSGVLTGSVAEGTDRSNWSSWLKGWGGIEQTERFIKDVNGKADPNALYMISTGGNDSYTVDTLGLEGATQKSASNIVTMIDNLAKAGATDFIVMLQSTTPGKTESDFTKAHRAATQKAVNAYIANHSNCNIIMVDTDDLFQDMEKQGKEAYGLKTWGFYQISDWVPAYGYAYAADDNSKLLPTNAAEDIYGYGYYYSKDSAYYTPEAAAYDIDEFLYYDEYHLASKTQMHKATYILGSDITTDKGSFTKVYHATPSAFAVSPLANKTYSMVYTFGDSMIDSGRALAVTSELVQDREVQSNSIRNMTDAKTNEWYSTYVNYVLQTGIMNGIQSDAFAPSDAMTRAQFVAILGRASGIGDSTASSPAAITFTDVDPSKYYASHVAWAVENGIINGTSAATFSPNNKISRQDMAKMIGVYAGVAGIKLPETNGSFTFTDDNSIKGYAKNYIYQLNEAGILVGYNSAFHPADETTRAAAASVLAKLLNY